LNKPTLHERLFLGLPYNAWAVLCWSVLLRSLGLNRPLLGHFSMYQTVNAMMARFFMESNFANLFYPQVNVLINGKPGLLLLAYPLNALIAALLNTFLGGSLDFWGRFQAVLFFAGAAIYLYKLCAQLLDKRLALASMIVFSLSPLTIIYGQSFQNEMLTLFFSVTFMYYWLIFLRKEKTICGVLSALSLSFVLITRPNSLFLLLPASYLCLFDRVSGNTTKRINRALFFLALAAILPTSWYFHLWKVSHEVNNIYSTLFAQLAVRSSFVSSLIFQSEYHQKLFDTLAGVALTPIGFTLFIVGFILSFKDWKHYGIFIAWVIGFWGSSLLIPRKLIDHNFYLLHFFVAAAPLIAFSALKIVDHFPKTSARNLYIGSFVVLSFFSSMRYALHPAFKTPAEDAHLLEIAGRVHKVTDPNSRIAVQGTHPLLYYADRYGWPLSLNVSKTSDYYLQTNWEKLPETQWRERNEAFKKPSTILNYLIRYEGATHFAMINPSDFEAHPDFAAYVRNHFAVIDEIPNCYSLFDLRKAKTA